MYMFVLKANVINRARTVGRLQKVNNHIGSKALHAKPFSLACSLLRNVSSVIRQLNQEVCLGQLCHLQSMGGLM